jgi:purine-binding chemotaxis protein CheW
MAPSGKLLHFLAGGRRFALPVASISEIREIQEVTPVPGTPDAISGLAEIRGRIVTLLDMVRIFDLPAPAEPGRLAVQFAEPLSHLALLVPAPVHALRTDAGAEAAGAPADDDPPAEPRPRGLGREVVLAGGEPVFLVDTEALIRHAIQRVRDRFRISA